MKARSALAALSAAAVAFGVISGATAQDKEDVTLSLWTHDGVYVEYFLDVAEDFRELHPDKNFTFDFAVTPDFFSVIVAAMASGEPVGDLVGIEQGLMQNFMENDIIARRFYDLREVLTEEEFALIPESKWAPYRHKGIPYGIESVLAATVFYYQPEMLESRGLAVPTTWAEFMEVGARLAEDGIALSALPDGTNLLQMYLMQRGVHFFDKDGNFVLNEPENRSQALIAMAMMQEGIEVGAFKPYVGGDFWSGSPIEAFRNGTVAGIVMPSWYSSFILKLQAEDMTGKWRVAPMPVYADGSGFKTTVWGGVGFAINKDSAHPELAADYIKFAYLDKENRMKFFEKYGYYPIMPDLYDDPRVKNNTDPFYNDQNIGEIMGGIVEDVPTFYSSVLRNAITDAVDSYMPSFYKSEITPEQFLDRIVEAVEDEIAFRE